MESTLLFFLSYLTPLSNSKYYDVKKFIEQIKKNEGSTYQQIIPEKESLGFENNELLKNLTTKLSLETNDQVLSLFKLTDKNRDDKISRDEFIKLIQTVDNDLDLVDILQLFDLFDLNKDGYIAQKEFCRVFGFEKKSVDHKDNYEFNDIIENISRYIFLFEIDLLKIKIEI